MIIITYFILKYDKNGIFLIKKSKILSILIFSQLHYVGTHVVMTVCAFGGHCMQKTLDFKLMLQICEIDLFLTKRPVEIVLPGCEWQQVKTLSYMTWEHTGTIKLINFFL